MSADIDVATEGLQDALRSYLEALGENMSRDGLHETPVRFAKQLRESVVGYQDDPKGHLKLFNNDGYNDLVVIRDITFSSLCEHHVVPFFGTVDIAYLPGEKILGLSKFARVVDAYGKRLQVQERLTRQIASLLEDALRPKLLLVQVSAKHMCMCTRGARRPNSVTETVIVRGDTDKYAHYVTRFGEMIRR